MNELIQIISQQFKENVLFNEESDMLMLEVNPENSFALIQFLKENPSTQLQFLTDVCGVHYPEYEDGRKLCVVYHMHNWITNVRVRIKVFVAESHPIVDSVSSLFESANWQERETFDFYGIVFKNHPDLRRILNMDEMIDFPLRKEFRLEDEYRTDKDNRFFGRELTQVNPS